MRGELTYTKAEKRHPLDWYVDEVWCGWQLARALGGFAREKAEGLAVWDPCCGYGHTIEAAFALGLTCHISDVVQNVAWDNFDSCPEFTRPTYVSIDFRETTAAPAPCTIVMNPPYSYVKGIAEAFARHALRLASGRVCALLPNKWLSSQGRYDLFMVDHPPVAVLHMTQRPSMPPGDLIHLMGKRAFRGGTIDYCWIVWDVANPAAPGETRVIWLPPLARMDETHLLPGAAL
jgi:hypothetical protein